MLAYGHYLTMDTEIQRIQTIQRNTNNHGFLYLLVDHVQMVIPNTERARQSGFIVVLCVL